MTIEEMNNILTKISSQTFQTKILNVILTQYKELKILENKVIKIKEKVNELVDVINRIAAPVQPEADALDNEMPPIQEVQNG